MADFNAMLSEIYTITNRPDLVAETTTALKSATLKAHSSDFYFKDLFETAIVYDAADYTQTIPYRTLFPRYRALKYLRKWDGNTVGDTAGKFFDIITPEEVLDSYNRQRNDVAYLAGDVIQVRSSTADLYGLMGVYLRPTVDTPATYKSWIADEWPYAIIFDAAATVFGLLQQDSAKASYQQMAFEQLIFVKNSNIVAVGS